MPADQERSSSKTGLRLDLLLIGFLILVYVLSFGPYVGKVGFYLDDWLMVSTLRGGPQDVIGAFCNYFFNDPKVIIRPVEVLHFGLLYFLFGSSPLGYHLVNGFLEICTAVLLFVAMKRFTGSRFLAFVTTASFIIYPIRDCTHYWILCSSVALSLSLYLGSLILSIKAEQEKKSLFFVVAALPFLLSIFNYEVFMPFACLTATCVFLISLRNASFGKAITQAVFSFLPLLVCGLALYAYQRILVPELGTGYLHRLTFDPLQVLHVIGAGTEKSSLFGALPFFQEQISVLFMQPLGVGSLISLAVIFAGAAMLSFHLLCSEGREVKLRTSLELAFAGVVAILTSLAIFGLNKEYEPTLMTLVNRIFTGASLGWSCIFAGLALTCSSLTSKTKFKALQQPLIACLCATLALGAVYFTLVNWQLAQPWVVSQRAQADVIFQVRNMRGKVKHPDVIILTDFPRYVMWSPIFDGIWDFQSMVRVVLDDPKIQAGVVSDRLVLEKGQIKDISVGYTCATYPLKNVKVYIPGKNVLLPVATAGDFVDIAAANSKQSLLSGDTVSKWRKQAEGTEK